MRSRAKAQRPPRYAIPGSFHTYARSRSSDLTSSVQKDSADRRSHSNERYLASKDKRIAASVDRTQYLQKSHVMRDSSELQSGALPGELKRLSCSCRKAQCIESFALQGFHQIAPKYQFLTSHYRRTINGCSIASLKACRLP